MKCVLIKLACDITLGEQLLCLRTVLCDLESLVEWTIMNLVTFNKGEYMFLCCTGWGLTAWEVASASERDVHILTGMSQHISLCSDSEKYQQHTRLSEQEHSQRVAGIQHSLDHHIGYTLSSSGSPNTCETLVKLKLVQWSASKMRGLEHVSRV